MKKKHFKEIAESLKEIHSYETDIKKLKKNEVQKIPIDKKTFGSFVSVDIDKDFEKFWSLVRINTESNQDNILGTFKKWMKENTVSIKDVCFYLDISQSKYYRIINGQEKLTFQIICEIAAMMSKKLKVDFVDF